VFKLPVSLRHGVGIDRHLGDHLYAALLEALSDPGHPEHDDLVAWVGEGFDPASFSLVEGNAAVQRVQQ
jgi:hypothetical protein